MASAERLIPQNMQFHTLLQPECPVYVHCSRRCIERRSGAVFLQVRMVNCGERAIRTVFLRVEGLGVDGVPLYTLPELIVPDCCAEPRAVFGEDRMLAIAKTPVASLRILVERVVFADGLLWRRLPTHRITSVGEAGWTVCSCGMPNPPEAALCRFCGARLGAAAEAVPEPAEPEDAESVNEPAAEAETPWFERAEEAPNMELPFEIRIEQPEDGSYAEPTEEKRPRPWLIALLSFLITVAALIVLAALAVSFFLTP